MSHVKHMHRTAGWILTGIVGLTAGAASADPIDPVVELKFNGNWNNTGTAGGTVAVDTINGHTATIGEGLEGENTGLDRRAAGVGMGSSGGSFVYLEHDRVLDDIDSLTLMGWMKSDQVLGGNTTLFHIGPSIRLLSDEDARLKLSLRKSGESSSEIAESAATGSWGATDEWIFFAVTYDGTQSTNNVHFYVGSEDAEAGFSIDSTTTLDLGTLANAWTDIRIGSSDNGNAVNGYAGLLDQLRIYASSGNGDGALSQAQVEDLWRQDLALIPEPASAALVGGALAGLGLLHRPRKQLTGQMD